MNVEKFYINEDLTVDVVIDISKNEIVTLSKELFENVMHEFQKKGLTEQKFVEDIGITVSLTERESAILDEQAQHDRELLSEAQRIDREAIKQVNKLFDK